MFGFLATLLLAITVTRGQIQESNGPAQAPPSLELYVTTRFHRSNGDLVLLGYQQALT
jgi:hypothetical protein